MSVWSSYLAPCEDHPDPDMRPLRYHGANHIPDPARDALWNESVCIACLPRYVRGERAARGIEPFLRLCVRGADGQGTVVLTAPQVRRVVEILTAWEEAL